MRTDLTSVSATSLILALFTQLLGGWICLIGEIKTSDFR